MPGKSCLGRQVGISFEMVKFETFEFETVVSDAMLTYDGTQSHREKRRTVTNNTNLARKVVEKTILFGLISQTNIVGSAPSGRVGHPVNDAPPQITINRFYKLLVSTLSNLIEPDRT